MVVDLDLVYCWSSRASLPRNQKLSIAKISSVEEREVLTHNAPLASNEEDEEEEEEEDTSKSEDSDTDEPPPVKSEAGEHQNIFDGLCA